MSRQSNLPENEPGVDLTEIMAVAAKLKGCALPSGPVIAPASMFPETQEKNRQAAAERAVNPEAGDQMADGTIYAGSMPTGEKLFAMPEDAKAPGGFLIKKFNKVALSHDELEPCAERLNQENYLGHNDWRLPTEDELDLLYQHKDKGALAGTFDESSVYWSSAPAASGIFNRVVKNFRDGGLGFSMRESKFRVRLVRRETPQNT